MLFFRISCQWNLNENLGRFGAILTHIQGWSNKSWKDALLLTFWELSFERGIRYHLRHKYGHLFLWDFELFYPTFKVVQTKVKNMHFWRLSRNWVLKVDFGTDLRDKHGHLFLWDLELFWPTFKVVQTNVQNKHFCWLSQNWVFKVDLGTHLRDKHGHLFFLRFRTILAIIKGW